ncbi:glutamic acid-rich protein-like, partial [Halyomorpha halys]|uniref:glutamic acid-rich protein-like n=1 Tax=Halyomorpha halys TaxID=286706 RepID=UPI0034D2888E
TEKAEKPSPSPPKSPLVSAKDEITTIISKEVTTKVLEELVPSKLKESPADVPVVSEEFSSYLEDSFVSDSSKKSSNLISFKYKNDLTFDYSKRDTFEYSCKDQVIDSSCESSETEAVLCDRCECKVSNCYCYRNVELEGTSESLSLPSYEEYQVKGELAVPKVDPETDKGLIEESLKVLLVEGSVIEIVDIPLQSSSQNLKLQQAEIIESAVSSTSFSACSSQMYLDQPSSEITEFHALDAVYKDPSLVVDDIFMTDDLLEVTVSRCEKVSTVSDDSFQDRKDSKLLLSGQDGKKVLGRSRIPKVTSDIHKKKPMPIQVSKEETKLKREDLSKKDRKIKTLLKDTKKKFETHFEPHFQSTSHGKKSFEVLPVQASSVYAFGSHDIRTSKKLKDKTDKDLSQQKKELKTSKEIGQLERPSLRSNLIPKRIQSRPKIEPVESDKLIIRKTKKVESLDKERQKKPLKKEDLLEKEKQKSRVHNKEPDSSDNQMTRLPRTKGYMASTLSRDIKVETTLRERKKGDMTLSRRTMSSSSAASPKTGTPEKKPTLSKTSTPEKKQKSSSSKVSTPERKSKHLSQSSPIKQIPEPAKTVDKSSKKVSEKLISPKFQTKKESPLSSPKRLYKKIDTVKKDSMVEITSDKGKSSAKPFYESNLKSANMEKMVTSVSKTSSLVDYKSVKSSKIMKQFTKTESTELDKEKKSLEARVGETEFKSDVRQQHTEESEALSVKSHSSLQSTSLEISTEAHIPDDTTENVKRASSAPSAVSYERSSSAQGRRKSGADLGSKSKKRGSSIDRKKVPTSLPSSPSKMRTKDNGNSVQLLTSEVFTRTIDSSGIEIVFKQPESLRKIIKYENEFSLIDTTDSSLSDSIALPLSCSELDISLETRHRLTGSPVSPKMLRRYEVVSPRLKSGDESSSSDAEYSLMKQKASPTMVDRSGKAPRRVSEERLSPILDVRSVTPPRRRYEDLDHEERAGNTTSLDQ